ncbi:UBC-like protein [Phanerochaete sordida]|uniref:UBC-like protein n=1 Tax=Phanerochaete sordida TaxID=48140 RepID=A0A9P3FXJ8_9APHY|nr:UBC-like protein [Phanerochaete sordida]
MSELSHRVLDFLDDTTDRLNRDLRSMKSEMMSGFVAANLDPPSRPRSRAPTRTSSSAAVAQQQHGPGVLTRTTLALEYAALRHAGHCPLGMYVTPRAEDLAVWDAVFFVHQGYYTDSILKFRIVFPPDYPTRPPTVQFLTDVFHPLVSQQDGLFNLAPRFKPWRPQEHHIFDVLHWIKAAFKKHALDEIQEGDCLNKEAFRYHDTTSSFAALATQSSMLSQSASALFDKDHPSMAGKGTHEMLFKELKPDQLAALRARIGLKEWEDPNPVSVQQ